MARTLKVVQKEDEPVALEVLATAIRDIADGVRKLRSGPLTDKCLFLLIQHAAPTRNRQGQRYGITEIKDILDGIEALEWTYLKKKKA